MESKRQKKRNFSSYNFLKKNSRGQGLSTDAIILIILGIIVLVILIIGFTLGWEKILPWISQNNVENIKTACSTACATANTYDFCTFARTLKASDLPSGGKEFVSTCNFLSSDAAYLKYGIEKCSSITCPASS